ncbi:hypothetical protein [Bacillus marinisedimentorum]|uniref:hypothetical protein n=1 Tax=Bacillus marinisedimentorum TaxID=1821260 RepID=UPI0007DF2F6F|nr:hypothetical protein [Bacillus marinisedimentorum]
MIRTAAASILGFVLLVIESFIVMELKGNATIEFGSMNGFITAWAMNFFLVFAMLTHFKMWLDSRDDMESQME